MTETGYKIKNMTINHYTQIMFKKTYTVMFHYSQILLDNVIHATMNGK